MKSFGYSPRRLAKLLDVSPNHLYGLIWRGEVKAVRLGRRVVIPRHELKRLGVLPLEEDGEPEAKQEV